MGVERIYVISGWKISLVDLVKELLKSKAIKPKDLANLHIWDQPFLDLIGVSAEEWKEGLEEARERFKHLEDIEEPYEEVEDWSPAEIIYSLEEFLELEVIGNPRKKIGWFFPTPGHDDQNFEPSNTFVVVGTVVQTTNLKEISNGVTISTQTGWVLPNVLGFFNGMERKSHLLSDDCYCCY